MLRAFRAHFTHEARVAALEKAMVVQASLERAVDEHVVRARGRRRHARREMKTRRVQLLLQVVFAYFSITISLHFLFKSLIAFIYAGVVGGCTGFSLTLVSSNA